MRPERALQLIEKNGADLVLWRELTGYDPEKSETYSGRKDKYPTSAIDWEYKKSDIDGTLILQTDLHVLAGIKDATMPTPEPGWLATYGGVTYRVMDCKAYRKAGVPIAYDLQLRKG